MGETGAAGHGWRRANMSVGLLQGLRREPVASRGYNFAEYKTAAPAAVRFDARSTGANRTPMPRRAIPMTKTCVRVLCSLLISLSAAAAWANDYQDVQRLHAAGQTEQALQAADKYIGAHPRDPQMRFVKANVLSGAGRGAEAEQVLTQLTRDYPELAEPWNNLAVLYAEQGQLDKARAALDSALRIQPEYATAQENLGDVLARQALQAYQHARRLDAANPRLAPKIETLNTLLAPAARPGS